MKQFLLSYLLLPLCLLANCASCVGQQNKQIPMGAIVSSDMFRTTDSIHYVLKYSQTPPNGRYTIYEITKFTAPPDPTRDTSSPPLYTVHDRHSSGTFSKGVKTGLWEHYTSERKVSEEVYKRGRRISKRNCPCKS